MARCLNLPATESPWISMDLPLIPMGTAQLSLHWAALWKLFFMCQLQMNVYLPARTRSLGMIRRVRYKQLYMPDLNKYSMDSFLLVFYVFKVFLGTELPLPLPVDSKVTPWKKWSVQNRLTAPLKIWALEWNTTSVCIQSRATRKASPSPKPSHKVKKGQGVASAIIAVGWPYKSACRKHIDFAGGGLQV